jgi:alkylhydroperoxidase/carboxymuconolactone decarboxylase family protein YurZ
MSDALNYLIAVRGDALGHYFKFLKDTGKHLDPKTRNLISVITKVYSQTEPGFKQYLTRALREGCTPIEVIDALLMAFPPWAWPRLSGRPKFCWKWTCPSSRRNSSTACRNGVR